MNDELRPPAERDEAHELLCAYLLGEATPEQVRRIEAALESDAELRAERTKLESTLSLVRGAVGPSQAESEERVARVAREAIFEGLGEDRSARWWPGWSSPLGLAASVLALIGAGLALQWILGASEGAGGDARPSTRLAQLERGRDVVPARGDQPVEQASELLGYIDSRGASAESAAPAAPRAESVATATEAGPASPGVVVVGGGAGGRFGRSYGGRSAGRSQTPLSERALPPAGSYRGPSDSVPLMVQSEAADDRADVVSHGVDLFLDHGVEELELLELDQLHTSFEELGIARPDVLDALEGAGLLPPGYTGDLSDDVGRQAVEAFLAARADDLARIDASRRFEELVAECRRRPDESLQDMFFRHWGQRPFVETDVDPVSTFAADVDTASYALARRMLVEGLIPSKAQVRTEEFVNYFDAELEPPREDIFAIHSDLGPAEFAPDGSGTWMLRVGLAGREVEEYERKPMNLTFVIDTSGSMKSEGRLELVKSSLVQLLGRLDGRDEIAIVRFSKEAAVALPRTRASQRARIEAALLDLEPGGGTNVEAGIELAFELASEAVREGANNRVVFLSDGVGNIGETDQAALLERVAEQRARGIYLNTIGFGLESHNDVFLEQLADRGDGVCNYVDSEVEARRALVENFTGTFETIARDVKLQVEFDPERVRRYRLLGYENRAMADREFTNDKVDAGEVGAGHSVVALYELEGLDLSGAQGQVFATVRVRFKPPFEPAGSPGSGAEGAREISRDLTVEGAHWSFESLPTGFAAAQCSAQLAEFLRRSTFTRDDSLEQLERRALEVAARFGDEAFAELAALISANREALEALVEPADQLGARIDRLKFLRYELEREREAEGEPDSERLEALERQVADEESSLKRQLLSGLAPGER
jgi:Ca-activated chloride channel family protein